MIVLHQGNSSDSRLQYNRKSSLDEKSEALARDADRVTPQIEFGKGGNPSFAVEAPRDPWLNTSALAVLLTAIVRTGLGVVTGASGFVGAWLTRRLLRQGVSVVTLWRNINFNSEFVGGRLADEARNRENVL
jgi:NAD dependent epimerase/dehydratase family